MFNETSVEAVLRKFSLEESTVGQERRSVCKYIFVKTAFAPSCLQRSIGSNGLVEGYSVTFSWYLGLGIRFCIS